jgi:Tol biopolymer transport system component
MWLRSMLVLLALGTLGCGGGSAATSGAVGSTSGANSSASAEAEGSMIAYDCGDTPDICVMQPDGSGVRRLASDPANDEDPGWSPDGSRIVFASSRHDRGTGRNQIYIMNADGSGVEQVTHGGGGKFEPDWSPDGSRLVFVGDRGGTFDIYVMNIDGSGLTNLTNSPASESDPAWSPNGRGILYTVDASTPQLWVMNSSGGDAEKLGSGLAADWSPDGSRLVFSETALGIAVVSLQDGSVTLLTHDPYDLEPTWSPDGTRIIFRRGQMADNADLYSVASDGGRLTRLTDDLAPETMPDWSPVMR